MQRVAARNCSIVLVTHKLAEIRKVAHRVTVLRGGRVVATSSDPPAEIDRLVRAMIGRQLEGLDATAGALIGKVARADDGTTAAAPVRRQLGDETVQYGLTVRDAEGVTRLDRFTLVVNRGEIVGIAGVEGNGQSELAAVLAGMRQASEGRFFVAGADMTAATPKQLTAAGVLSCRKTGMRSAAFRA